MDTWLRYKCQNVNNNKNSLMAYKFQGSCDPENHDCNCVDSSFAECSESEAENKVVSLFTCIVNTHFLHPHHGISCFHFVPNSDACDRSCSLHLPMWFFSHLPRYEWRKLNFKKVNLKRNLFSFAFKHSLSGCDYLIFSENSEDENCHLSYGGFSFQVCPFLLLLKNVMTFKYLGLLQHLLNVRAANIQWGRQLLCEHPGDPDYADTDCDGDHDGDEDHTDASPNSGRVPKWCLRG